MKSNKEQTSQRASLAVIGTLALWRSRQTWRQLLMIGLALVVACTIACVPALFSAVANTAGLQELFNGSPARTTFALKANVANISSKTVSAAFQEFEKVLRPGLGPYLDTTSPTLSVEASKLTITDPERLNHINPLSVYATPMQQIQPALQLVQGRWASEQMVNGVVEFMLGASTAHALGLTVGSTLIVQSNFSTIHTHFPVDTRGELTLHLVGIFADPIADAPALHSNTFQPVQDYFGTHYTFLLPSTAFLQACDQIAAREGSSFVTAGSVDSIFHLTWYYQLRTAQLQFGKTDDLTSRLASVQYKVTALPTGQSRNFPYINDASFLNPSAENADILSLLSQYTSRIAILNLPLSLLALQTIALLLFFACLLIHQLVERQMTMSAHLSSHGASSVQVRWSLIAQGIGFCVLALVLGPLLGSLMVYTLAHRILPADEQAVLSGVFRSPGHIVSLVVPYLGGTFLAGLLAVSLPCWFTSNLNLLELRRESTRASKQPFWLRYYLDLLAALLAFSSFGVALYLAQIARTLDLSTQELIIAPLTLTTPFFLLLGVLLLFLRAFPLLLRGAARLSRPTRGMTSMLALVQMARNPRQATRLIMLLTLATTFASFALIFSASQNQRALDIAAYGGADFAGNVSGGLITQIQQDLPLRYREEPPEQLALQVQQVLTQHYRSIPGVLAASAGYTDISTSTGLGGTQVPLALRAVDTDTFAHAAIWQPQDSAQSLSTLMHLLQQHAPLTPANLVVPAIVDEATLNNLHLSLGETFGVVPGLNMSENSAVSFQVLAVVQYIPGVSESLDVTDPASVGGVLVDYRAYSSIYLNYQTRMLGIPPQFAQTLSPNYLWLHTSDEPRALASVRANLNSSNLALTNLYDRRAVSADLQSDPLIFSVLFLLSIGGITALLLAFLGNLIASWLNVRLRLNSFVVLRALGATRGQVMSILIWEQGIVYIVALVLSLLLGAVLARLVVPALIFTGLPSQGILSNANTEQFYLLQRIPAPQVVVPLTLQLAWPAIVLACALALFVMARVISRASYGQELRLNED